jgi:deoxyribose-phosphate aldolase
VAQVAELRQLARGRVAVKASGGIASLEQALELVEAGASRLGTSRGVALIRAGKNFGQRPDSAPRSGDGDQDSARDY